MVDIVYKAKTLLKDMWRAILLLGLMAMMGVFEYAAWTYGSSWAATMEKVYAWLLILVMVLFLLEAIAINRRCKKH